jgi:hypothetical protein
LKYNGNRIVVKNIDYNNAYISEKSIVVMGRNKLNSLPVAAQPSQKTKIFPANEVCITALFTLSNS